MKIRIIFEAEDYYNAIYEVQSQIRDKLKWEKLTEKEEEILEWVGGLIIRELEERKLKHYWSE